MEVRMRPAQWPDLEQMQRTIRDAGFQPVKDQVELVVTGTLARQGGEWSVLLDGMQDPVRLALKPARGVEPGFDQHAGKPVQITGLWEPGDQQESPGMLSVNGLKAAPREK